AARQTQYHFLNFILINKDDRMQSYVLGIDIGTGSVKSVAIDAAGRVLYNTQIYYDMEHPQPGFCEQDPRLIFDAFVRLVHTSVGSLGRAPELVTLSSAMHSLILVSEDGEPLTNLILWSDSRSAVIANDIKNSKKAKTIYTHTGTPIHSMSPLCKIIWFRTHAPEVFQQAG